MATVKSSLRARGGWADRVFSWVALAAAALVLVVLSLIAITMTKRSWAALDLMGPDFFSSSRWAPPDKFFGAAAFATKRRTTRAHLKQSRFPSRRQGHASSTEHLRCSCEIDDYAKQDAKYFRAYLRIFGR